MKRILLLLIMLLITFTLLANISPIVFIGGGVSWESREVDNIIEETFNYTGDFNIDYDLGTVFAYNFGVAVDITYWEYPISTEVGVKYLVGGYHDEYSSTSSGYDIISGSYGTHHFEGIVERKRTELDVYSKAKYIIISNSNYSLLPFIGFASSYLLTSKKTDSVKGSFSPHIDKRAIFVFNEPKLTYKLLVGCVILLKEHYILGLEYDMGLTDRGWGGIRKSRAVMLNIGYKF